MRLTSNEVASLLRAVSTFEPPGTFALYLHGSRTRDDLHGGDIDLVLVVDAARVLDLEIRKHELLHEMKTRVGDQRIDLVIADEKRLAEDPFLVEAMRASARLG